MTRLSEFDGLRVVTETGATLGCIREVQSPGDGKREPQRERRRIAQLVCGGCGFLGRLCWRARRTVTVPWSKVLRREANAFVVAGDAADYARVSP